MRVLLRTSRLLAVDKPPWLLSVPGKGPEKQDCAAARVRAMVPEATGPLVVHRLDMETSGVLVFGLDPEAQRSLSMQFERREVEKRYVALLREPPDREIPDSGEITLPIRADLERRPFQIVDPARGDRSTTRFCVLARAVSAPLRAFADDGGFGPPAGEPAREERVRCALVEFEPLTGRTHQLRVHAAAPREQGGLGAPILGDSLYGPERAWTAESLRPERLFLHSSRLVVLDPDSIAPPPARPRGRGAQMAPVVGPEPRRLTIESPVPFGAHAPS